MNQTIIVSVVVALCSVYLLLRTWRYLTSRDKACGGGCACAHNGQTKDESNRLGVRKELIQIGTLGESGEGKPNV